MTDYMPRKDLAAPPRMPEAQRIADLEGEVALLKDALTEARRRRDEWRAKAEGFDAIRLALREKVGTPWPPHLSRLMWAGIAADEKARADKAEAEVARLQEIVAHYMRMFPTGEAALDAIAEIGEA